MEYEPVPGGRKDSHLLNSPPVISICTHARRQRGVPPISKRQNPGKQELCLTKTLEKTQTHTDTKNDGFHGEGNEMRKERRRGRILLLLPKA